MSLNAGDTWWNHKSQRNWVDTTLLSVQDRTRRQCDSSNPNMEALQHSLLLPGTCEEQIKKIFTLLRLTEMSKDSPENREKYFYTAVEIAQRYIADSTTGKPYWEEIISTFLFYIRPGITPLEVCSPAFMQLVHDYIQWAGRTWTQNRLDRTADLKNNFNSKSTPSEILASFEAVFGPVRLVIISDDSREAIIRHNASTGTPNTIYKTQITIFNRKKNYTVAIDQGDDGLNNQIVAMHWNNYIKALVDIYVEKMEDSFFREQHNNLEQIHQKEAQEGARILSMNTDYSAFLSRALATIEPWLDIDTSYIPDCMQALRICKILTVRHSQSRSENKKNILKQDIPDIPQELDCILGWTIDRRVLRMVTTMLLSRDETMNGLGYPTGLNKDNIHVLSKVLSIIRVYESVCIDMSPVATIDLLTRWANWGYWDTRVVEIFIDILKDGKIWGIPMQNDPHEDIVTLYRRRRYAKYIQSWGNIISTIADIESQYALLRDPSSDIRLRSATLLAITELESELREELEAKMIIVTRHGETESDKKWWKQPGSNEEWLTKRWIRSSQKIWKWLKWLKLDIRTSETERGTQTAKSICQNIQHCVTNCLSSGVIAAEPALRNRTKNEENGYGDSFFARIISTHPGEIIHLIRAISFSSKSNQVLLISHADSIKAIDAIMRTLDQKNEIHVTKISVPSNSAPLVYFIRWWRLIRWHYFFTIANWRSVTNKVNTIIKIIFMESLYPVDMKDVDLFDLHNQLLDYIDLKNETDPEKVWQLIQALDENPLTVHFSAILRTEWVIK